MHRRPSHWIALALTCLSVNAFGLDLSEAYQAALVQDAGLNAARANAQAGRESVPQARAQLFPNVSLSYTRNNVQLETSSPNALGQVAGTSYAYPSRNDSAVVRQPVYRRGLWAQYKQSLTQQDEIDAILDGEMQNLGLKVASAYFEALSAQDHLALIRAQGATYRAQLDAARKMFAGGSGTRTDIDETQARLDMNTAQELEATQNVELTRQQLQTLTNQPVDSLAALNPQKLELLPPAPNDVNDWVARAELASPEMRMHRSRLASATLEIDKAQAGHLPTLDAVAQWTRSMSENTQAVESGNATRSLGLQLNIPVFSGGSVSSAIRQAVAGKTRAEQLLEGGRRDLSLKVYREYRGVTEGILKVKALEQAVKSAEQALVSATRSFQAGSRTRLDILNAENSRMLAIRDLGQSRYIYLLSHLRLKALVNENNAATIDAMNAWFQE